jgi:hypothetical protein
MPCSEYKEDGGRTFAHGVPDISKDHIVSFMGDFVEGVLHPFICNATFFQALYFPLFFYGHNIRCYVKGNKESTTIPLEFRAHRVSYALEIRGHCNALPHQVRHFIHFIFKRSFMFYGESFHWSEDIRANI